MRKRLWILCFFIAWLWPFAVAFAQPTLSGKWSATALVVQWNIGDWGAACGPRPGGGGQGGGTVMIQQTGNELNITGLGRNYSTTQCWEQYPGIQRRSHSAGRRGWRNVCRTPASDPRQASIVTTLTATDNAISFDETGQYQFIIKGQNCTASVRRTRSFSLLQRDGEAATPATQQPAASEAKTQSPAAEPKQPSGQCATPGPPTRLEVRPARKLMRAGEEFQFRAKVLDHKGCVVGQRPAWEVVEGKELVELSGNGKVHIKPDAKQGEVKLSAKVKGRAVEVLIEVASNERYEAILRQGGFNEAGESREAAEVTIATGSIGGKSVVSKASQNRVLQFAAVGGAFALCFGIAGLIVIVRYRRKRLHEKARQAAILAYQASQPPPPMPAPPTNKICPLCGELYPAQSEFCGKDGASLVPVN